MKINVFSTPDQVLPALASEFITLGRQAIADHGRFSVALSGGSSPRKLYELLASDEFRTQLTWDKVDFFFGDERCVPHTSDDSNYRMARLALLEPLQIADRQVFAVDTVLAPAQAAEAYTQAIRHYFAGRPAVFDLVLLGLGDDAHTASLFPGTDVLRAQAAEAQAVFLEDKQVHRITLTAPLINQARHVVFLVYGADKAPAVQQVLETEQDPTTTPARLIRPASQQLSWFLDEAAAAKLNKKG